MLGVRGQGGVEHLLLLAAFVGLAGVIGYFVYQSVKGLSKGAGDLGETVSKGMVGFARSVASRNL
jgi:hypothetical protein